MSAGHASLRICFVARQDFMTKPGGDTVQWQMYDRLAREAGHTTRTWFADEPRPEADVYHAFNIDRPLELYPKLRAVRRAGGTYVLSSIHHPNAWLERFRRVHPPGGRLGRIFYRSPLGCTVPASESIKEVARLIQQRRPGRLGDLVPGWSARVRWLLENAARITLLAPAEEEFLRRDFAFVPATGQAAVLPNWVEGIDPPDAAVPGEQLEPVHGAVLVVARIEARKNQVDLARQLGAAGHRAVFIGRPNPNEPGFVRAFESAVARHPSVRWLPGVPRATLAHFYAAARVLLNGSYVEVSPLVDIEALASGCPVITTRYALHHSLLPPGTPVVDPYDPASIETALGLPLVSRSPRYVVSPEECSRTLLEIYAAAAANRA